MMPDCSQFYPFKTKKIHSGFNYVFGIGHTIGHIHLYDLARGRAGLQLAYHSMIKHPIYYNIYYSFETGKVISSNYTEEMR